MVVRFSEIRLLYFSTFLLFAEFCNTCVYNICLSSLNSCSLSTLFTSWLTMFSVFAECDCSRIDLFTSVLANVLVFFESLAFLSLFSWPFRRLLWYCRRALMKPCSASSLIRFYIFHKCLIRRDVSPCRVLE